MTAPTVFTAAGAADFLRLVPRLVGMRPTRSLVIAAFTGTRTGSALRVDLPGPGADLSAFADTIVGLVCRIDAVDGIAAVAYTDAGHRAAMRGSERALLGAVSACADRAGLVVKDVLLVAADQWSSLMPGRDRAPRPTTSIPDDPSIDLLDVDAEARLPERSPAVQHRFERAVAARLIDGADDLLQLDPSDRIEAALSTGASAFGVPDEATVLLAAALRIPALRDVVLLQIGWGARFGSHAWARGGEQRPLRVDEPVTMAFTGGDMVRPDHTRLRRATERLVGVAALTPRELRAPVLGAIAWLHWALGRGTVAGRFVDLARQADPACSFANLLTATLASGRLPEWVYRDTSFSVEARRWSVDPGATARAGRGRVGP